MGTSGFAYPTWAPAFYPPGTRGDELLPAYAARLPAVELSSTYYRSPTPAQVAVWAGRVPVGFRFTVKLQRERSRGAFVRGSAPAVAALAEPLDGFGTRVGAALYRVSADLPRDDERLASLLLRWPSGIPLALELVHRSWHVDEVHDALRPFGAALVVTETDTLPEPPVTLTGDFLYLRLRRTAYGTADLDAWAARLEPFLADGRDAFVFFRHDEDGSTPRLAIALAERLSRFDPRP